MKNIHFFRSWLVIILLLAGCSINDSPLEPNVENDILLKSGKKHPVPFLCEFKMWSEPAVPAPTIELEVYGSGVATHMGKIAMKVNETITTTVIPWTAASSVVLTAANGDELHFDYASVIDPSDMPPAGDGDLIVLGECTVTGGTGRFEDATGNFIYSGVFNAISSTGTGKFQGVIMY